MLQQTQVATVLPYYERWMRRFPTLESLARANEQEALACWQGLGYYRRCRLLQQGAQWVLQNGVPKSASEWRKVPGVGPYTAGALASICCGEAAPLVDGNVERVFARLTACELSGPALNRAAWAWASGVMHASRPAEWNQALMELGARVCRPRKPDCSGCPVAAHCTARIDGRQDELPRRPAKPETVHLRQFVWVPISDGRFGIRQIAEGEWWAGMWEFPRATEVSVLESLLGSLDLAPLGRVRHQVTHHKISIEVSLARTHEATDDLRWVGPEELAAIPMPAPQRKAHRLLEASFGTDLFSQPA